jgi:predicted unusual protein kinase regulating ubiquinone biosynthesis (AarF/ABC1/UbiB family)
MVIAVGLRDVARMTQSYKMLGVLLPGADTNLLEEAAVQVFERFWGKSMAELTQISLSEVYEFAREFSGVIYSMPFQVPQDLIFLGRAVGILSGMCTGLDPEFNLFEHLVPYAQKLITQEAVSGWRSWVQEAETIALKMLALPGRTEALLSKIERGDLSVSDPRMTETMRRMERSTRRLGGSLMFAALLLGGIQLYLGGVTTFGIILMVMAGLTLAWVAFSRR